MSASVVMPRSRTLSRRSALRLSAASVLLANGVMPAIAQVSPVDRGKVEGGQLTFPAIAKSNEAGEENGQGPLPPRERVGFAVVALGRLSIEQILPAFAQARKCRLAALVSGSPVKLSAIGAQYGLTRDALHTYDDFEKLGQNEDVRVVYIVLPNSMHKEFVLRASAIRKHVLCEKPMATTSEDAKEMVDACAAAAVKLMIAYRCRYQPHHLEIIKRSQSGELGPIKLIEAINAQNQGDPEQWRLKRALAGGGALPDVGIYCLNAARAVMGEEPTEVEAAIQTTPNDPRFREVEESVAWLMRFPSGAIANLSTSYGVHRASRLAVHLDAGSMVMENAFPYKSQRLMMRRAVEGLETDTVLEIGIKDHFAAEMDHMADCVLRNEEPRTPGEEGLRDMKLMEAIYASAEKRSAVKIS